MGDGQRSQDGLAPGQQDGQGPLSDRLRHLTLRWNSVPEQTGPLRRRTEGSMVGGVAGGLAAKTGLDVTVVRIAIVVATLLYGIGAVVYMAAWLLVPAAGADASIGSKALSDKRGIGLAAGLASLLAVVLIIASFLNIGWLTALALPLIICTAGLVLVWRNAPPDEQQTLRKLGDPVFERTGHAAHPVRRLVLAGILLAGGAWLLLSGHRSYHLLRPLGALVLVVISIAVALGPWWMRLARDLVDERQARIRAEERADVASRVHDSVLQTLALIQRRAADPQQVVQLARAQERELRGWLFDGVPPGSIEGKASTLAAGVRLIQQQVEAQHGMAIEAVTVGDCELDDDLRALLAAAREATVNAAKWSGAAVVSLFAEVDPGEVALYVRDRGKGFDPAGVPADRKGLAESIHTRMTRRGGSASVRSAPGEGTEVTLRMPRKSADRVDGRSS